MYEVFLATHIILQLAGLVFLFLHYHTSRPYVATALAIFLTDRLIFRLWLKSTTRPATLTILPDNETVLLSATWPIPPPSLALAPSSTQSGWPATAHVFLTIPSLSLTSPLQAHPFTIFSPAAERPPPPTAHNDVDADSTNPRQPHAHLSLLIRPQNPPSFTASLLAHARLHPNTRIRLDGPYGSPRPLATLAASDTAIVIAAGSGIAVAYPAVCALVSPLGAGSHGDMHDEEGSVRRPGTRARRVLLLWIVRAEAQRGWVSEGGMEALRACGVGVWVCGATGVVGRPDVRGLMEGWVSEERGRTGVLVSGPDGLVRDVRNVVAGMVGRGGRVSVVVEKFGW